MTQATADSRAVSAGARPPIAILGVPFDNVTKAEVIERIERMVTSRQPHYLVTPNVDFLVQAREDIELRRILFEAHLVLYDGTPLVSVAEQKGYRLFLLGATPESSGQAVRRLFGSVCRGTS
jgi:UDP-N-acetyl-D-mannosaminuronic acid transferase (WecB/TagA/CpsF family)